MFNLEEHIKKVLIDLYNTKTYIGAKVRELALNYMIKGYITQETVIYIEEYITNAEKPVETEEVVEEAVSEEIIDEEIIENNEETEG